MQSCCDELHVTQSESKHVVLHVGKENCFCTASRQRCLKCMIPQLTCDSFFSRPMSGKTFIKLRKTKEKIKSKIHYQSQCNKFWEDSFKLNFTIYLNSVRDQLYNHVPLICITLFCISAALWASTGRQCCYTVWWQNKSKDVGTESRTKMDLWLCKQIYIVTLLRT